MATRNYTANWHIKHNGKIVEPGATLELTDEQAAAMAAAVTPAAQPAPAAAPEQAPAADPKPAKRGK